MKAVILVGGEGTRLRPVTLDVPKPLVPVANRPFLEHVLANLSRHGVDEAILTTGYRAEDFDAFGAEHMHGVKLTIVREEEPLGTCGAVKNVEHMLDGTFLVLNGDILTNLDLGALLAYHRSKDAVGTLTLTPVPDPSAYGLVPISDDGRIERFIEKPTEDEVVTDLINAGTYVLETETLKQAPEGENYSFERGLFPGLLAEGAPLYGLRSTHYWLDVGTPEKYLRANKDVLEGRVGETPRGRHVDGGWLEEGAEVGDGVRLVGSVAVGRDVCVEDGAILGPLVSIGPRCRIAPNALVTDSVLHAGTVVEEGAVVERAICGRGARIGAQTMVVDAVLGHGVRIGARNELRAGVRLWPRLEIPDESVRF